ncbi:MULTISPECIES: hypothetical protein [unclassified Okeania]|uniref:hypothetical protein n=1 Tax=unclassified Okeania TaxID=2634635 RepID=UPI0013BD4CFD|nr:MULTISPECIES: hypothetical protein [unclassified Okeania]NES75977.1 hypothetical protein [Okeania sp. SIO1H4]NET19571.1 hypothetical protein [Okeania sp. SIO1H5]NET97292.1 hypothetical protein [Okeania sp. SIO1H2]
MIILPCLSFLPVTFDFSLSKKEVDLLRRAKTLGAESLETFKVWQTNLLVDI